MKPGGSADAGRTSRYRRRGPDRRPLPVRLTDPLRRALGRTQRRRGPWQFVRVAAALTAPVIVGVTTLRKRLGVPPSVALPSRRSRRWP